MEKEGQEARFKRREQVYRDRRDISLEYSDSELLERYRFDRDGIGPSLSLRKRKSRAERLGIE